jgi:hypothetical protein
MCWHLMICKHWIPVSNEANLTYCCWPLVQMPCDLISSIYLSGLLGARIPLGPESWVLSVEIFSAVYISQECWDHVLCSVSLTWSWGASVHMTPVSGFSGQPVDWLRHTVSAVGREILRVAPTVGCCQLSLCSVSAERVTQHNTTPPSPTPFARPSQCPPPRACNYISWNCLPQLLLHWWPRPPSFPSGSRPPDPRSTVWNLWSAIWPTKPKAVSPSTPTSLWSPTTRSLGSLSIKVCHCQSFAFTYTKSPSSSS